MPNLPLPPDSMTSIPPGIGRAASPPPMVGMSPPGMQGPPGMSEALPQGPEQGMPDLFQRVAALMMKDPKWVLIMAGMGLREALEKSGKYESKPHRSNQEIQAGGGAVGNPGQTGMPMPDQLAQQMGAPPIPGGM